MVKLDFPLLVFQLAEIQASLVKSFDSIGDVGMNVDGGVDNTVSTNPEDSDKL